MHSLICSATSVIALPTNRSPAFAGAEPYVELGGNITKVKSYGELVTSIINPSHDLAKGYAEEVVSEDGESICTTTIST